MELEGCPAVTFTDVSWLPPGSSVEVWLGDAPVPRELCTGGFALPSGCRG